MFKNIVILGSTGSIGVNTLDVVDRFPNKFRVIGLTAFNNSHLLEQQIAKYHPKFVAVGEAGLQYLKKKVDPRQTKILNVETEVSQVVALREVDLVVVAMKGSVALEPFLCAIRSGKTVATANKEALVIAGGLILKEAQKNAARIIPIDSEQSAIFQCLEGRCKEELDKIFLTASGGVLRDVPKQHFDKLSVSDILKHPRWKMGKRITVDSASMMNKGFEIMEAKWLFDVSLEDIEVVVHPEAVIHSMVGFRDGSIIAQLGITDMRLPIQYALTYPNRCPSDLPKLDFYKMNQLSFQKPDFKKFPCLALAMEVAGEGGSLPCVLNAADEEAVDAFLNEDLRFTAIYDVVAKVVRRHKKVKNPSLEDIRAADLWAREEAEKIIYN